MTPCGKIHNIAKCAEHTVRTDRDFFGAFIHQRIDIFTLRGSFFLFFGTKSVAVPAHHQAGLKCKRFILPKVRLYMAVHPYIAAVRYASACGVIFILPKCPAENSRFVRFRYADSDCPKLGISAADNNGRSFFQSGFFSALFADVGNERTAFLYRREDIAFKTATLSNRFIPCPLCQ